MLKTIMSKPDANMMNSLGSELLRKALNKAQVNVRTPDRYLFSSVVQRKVKAVCAVELCTGAGVNRWEMCKKRITLD